MAKKVRSKQELLDQRDELIAQYRSEQSRAHKAPLLTKKERKVLGIGKDLGKASIQHVRIAPRKVNLVAGNLRGKSVKEALAILTYTPKMASPTLFKLIKSAAANAVNNNGLSEDLLYIADLSVSHGPILKRWIARGKGSASSIHKRTSHISVVVKERAEGGK